VKNKYSRRTNAWLSHVVGWRLLLVLRAFSAYGKAPRRYEAVSLVFRLIYSEVFQRQPSLFALLISVLSSLLTILSTQYTHHKFGQPILRTLLSPDYLLHLNSYLTGSHNELIIATLKLFRAMSAFGGGCEKRAVLEGFSWGNKVRMVGFFICLL
jgi:hypothetical protein